jgi:hypothetical protein
MVGLLLYTELAAFNVAQQSQAVAQTGSLSGMVVSLAGEAIPAAKVSVFRGTESNALAQASTDSRGAFLFEHLPAGRYSVAAEKPGFLNGRLGVSKQGQPEIQVALDPGEAARGLVIRLGRGGHISGRIIDQRGDARANILVQLVASRPGAATARRPDGPPSIPSTTTDDLGRYELSAVAPGRYLVVALPPQVGSPTSIGRTSAGLSVYLPAFYPSVFSVRQAQPISVIEAGDASQIDIQFSPQPAGTVEGTVTGLLNPRSTVQVSLVDSSIPSFLPPRTVDVDREGRFTLSGVAPGEYVVVATTLPAGLWARGDLTIQSAGKQRIALVLEPIGGLVGRIAPELPDPRLPDALSAVLDPVVMKLPGMPTQHVAVAPGGYFAFAGVVPGSYRLSFSSGDSSFVARTIRTDTESRGDGVVEQRATGRVTRIEVQIGNGTVGLTASLKYRDGRPAQDHCVVLFPSSSELWLPSPRRIQVVRPDSKGQFTITGVDPGEYKVVAITEMEPGSEYDREALATWSVSGLIVRMELGKITRRDLVVPDKLDSASRQRRN